MANMNIEKASEIFGKIKQEINKAVIGKDEIIKALMLGLIAGGHVLIEGPPGSAKTTIAKSFAKTIGGTFKRIQFTPDMMPADITGFNLYSTQGTYSFIEGPIFANIILADELNRTIPRTQSALLEAMQEHQVTIEGKTLTLKLPFMVVATQVLAGGEGTYPLTDVQMDRFMLRVFSQYLSKDEEALIINGIDAIDTPDINTVTTPDEIIKLQQLTKQVHVSLDIVNYITAIVHSNRKDLDVAYGLSTRSGISIFKSARVFAALDGRAYVIPDDVKRLAYFAIQHRFRIKPEAEMDDITPRMVINKALNSIPVPKFDM